MEVYEIRIFKGLKASASVYRTTQTSDFTAIRVARSVAEEGDAIEVWRGMNCIYAEGTNPLFSIRRPAANPRQAELRRAS